MISGMYMGEIARQVLVQLVDDGLLFQDKQCEALREKGMFFTKYISEIERYVCFTSLEDVMSEISKFASHLCNL